MQKKPGVEEGADARRYMVFRTSAPPAKKRPVDTQVVEGSQFGLERRAGWNVSRRAMRLIDLERRARFSRVESA